MTTAASSSSYSLFSRQKGISLIELLVAMVIGLIITLAIFSVLDTFEDRKRKTSSVNDIDQAGNYAAYVLDKWIRSAGSGFTQADGASFGCTLTATKAGVGQILPRTAALPAPFASVNTGTANVFKLIPILIAPEQTTPGISGNRSDVLIVMAGSSGRGEVATAFSAVPSASQLNLINTIGFSGNDLALIVKKGSPATPCLIEQVSASFAEGASTALTLNTSAAAGVYYGATVNSKSIISYSDIENDTVLNLGNATNSGFLVIGVGNNNTLMGYDLLQSQNPVNTEAFTITDGVFEMHALYGIDTTNDGKVDSWVSATGNYAPSALSDGSPLSISRIKQIKAIRIGLIMRTSQREKDNVNNKAAGATVSSAPDKLYLFSDLGLTLTRTLSSAEQKFRYRTIETTIPLRNQIMLSIN